MAKLKIFFHDNCFDGAASAAVFADFYKTNQSGTTDIVFQGVQHKQGDPFADLAIDGDVNACVDFRYCSSPKMTWWFDHHISAFQPKELQQHFENDQSGKKFYDPTARSNCKFQSECLEKHFDYHIPPHLEELIYWADIIDGAQFADAKTAVELKQPALRLMTWIENNEHPEMTHRFIRALGTNSLATIAEEPWVKQPLIPLLEKHEKDIELLRKRAVCDKHIVSYDLLEDGIGAHNKFISYFLFPEAHYTVGLTSNQERIKISVGSNPWLRQPRKHNIAAICERYGGGGHPVVGAVSLPCHEVDQARSIAAAIRQELAGN